MAKKQTMIEFRGGGATSKSAPDCDLTISHSEDNDILSPKNLKRTCLEYFYEKMIRHSELASKSVETKSKRDFMPLPGDPKAINVNINRLRLGGRSDQPSRNAAFTMAEVLITLGIIGIIAAMTLPSLIANYQKKVLKEQFKVAYSLIQQAFVRVVANLEYTPECYYWLNSPYKTVCIEWDKFGHCTKSGMADGSPKPADISGRFGDCELFRETFEKNIQVIGHCRGSDEGCIPDYEGYDTVLQNNSDTEMSDDEAFSLSGGCTAYRKSEIQRRSYVYILKNGMILIPFQKDRFAVFLIDINGKKGPNKWGYDLFSFTTKANYGTPLVPAGGFCMIAEKGGLTTTEMIEQMNRK